MAAVMRAGQNYRVLHIDGTVTTHTSTLEINEIIYFSILRDYDPTVAAVKTEFKGSYDHLSVWVGDANTEQKQALFEYGSRGKSI